MANRGKRGIFREEDIQSDNDEVRSSSQSPPVRVQEQLLIELIPQISGERIYCNSAGRGQFAMRLGHAAPNAVVECLFLDLYQQQKALSQQPPAPENVRWLCQGDFPGEPADRVVLCCSKRGESELTRDLLQQGQLRLKDGGKLITAIDFAEDQWLHQEMKRLFPKVTRRPHETGVVYLATKNGPLTKIKSHDSEFMVRDGECLIRVKTRPGVFSHRHIDLGARQLINAMTIHANMRVLDLGCGSGVVGLAAACRADQVRVVAVDSNPRACQCVEWGAAANQLTTVTAVLDADGSRVPESAFDLVLANPPYFSNWRIAEIFLQTALKGLCIGGEILLVTKSADWYLDRMPELFHKVQVRQSKDYFLVSGRKES